MKIIIILYTIIIDRLNSNMIPAFANIYVNRRRIGEILRGEKEFPKR